jgi:hypothetical protein
MRSIIDWLNFPKHIKNYILIKKIDGYSKNSSGDLGLFIIDFLMILLFAAAIYYVYFINTNNVVKKFGFVIFIVFFIYFIVKFSAFSARKAKQYDGIKKLILKNEEGRNVKIWDIEDKTALLIGKSGKDNEVDIDLTESEYATLISKQHAVMNYTSDSWYIEDIGSTNGSGIKRINENRKVMIEPGKPYKINVGDTIYIANTKILVK